MSSLAYRLLTPEAVRERSTELYAAALDGRLPGWRVHPEALPACADLVAAEIRSRYPTLEVPFHARWRHFTVGGVDRWAALRALADFPSPAAEARAAFDLAILSVLLDAGAGAAWRYAETGTGQVLRRSEGLAVASLAMFAAGAFAEDGVSPRADAARLARITEAELAIGFQAGETNPLIGLAGRAALLRRLGEVALAAPEVFARADSARPGGIFDLLAAGGEVPARAILIALLRHLGPIWPGREALEGVPLGDCWRHPGIRRADETAGLVPFHKLSQWLAYSLVEPLQAAGQVVVGLDALTGLAEYRNGGLFLDAGVIALEDPEAATREHAPGDPLVVGWRALTVALLDAVAPLVRERLGLTDFPLARVLEGGTWWVGRRLAAEKREDGGPPLKILSDGTLF
ncbi:URC4/urg3 family protein [Siccirubricoccus sp. KC 17139]|uniref:URC4/urg3 family protein n=1 Tax=Siccirubricoccus soli TaxID=2899147 RepID=A0ABT1D4F2_9PROT|nr:URC4/urg3 family protein [Siccirubricoccus soli]MCP2682884.1 URC4/urg3 family protein [Siccirubricoccus soli]